MKRYLIASALGAMFLASCSNPPTGTAGVDATVLALTTAEKLALIYTSLPRCPASGPCSDPTTVAKIKALDNTAYSAVKAAEQNPALLGAAIAALSNLQAAVPAPATGH